MSQVRAIDGVGPPWTVRCSCCGGSASAAALRAGRRQLRKRCFRLGHSSCSARMVPGMAPRICSNVRIITSEQSPLTESNRRRRPRPGRQRQCELTPPRWPQPPATAADPTGSRPGRKNGRQGPPADTSRPESARHIQGPCSRPEAPRPRTPDSSAELAQPQPRELNGAPRQRPVLCRGWLAR